jgi:hypothetical protein
LQVKFLVVVNLFVSRSFNNNNKKKPWAAGKNSGERSLHLRPKRMKYNILLKLSLRDTTMFSIFYFSKCNLLYRSSIIILEDIQNFPTYCNQHLNPQRKFWSADTTGYLNHQLLKVKRHYFYMYQE